MSTKALLPRGALLGVLLATMVPAAARAEAVTVRDPQFDAIVSAYQRDFPGLTEDAALRAATGQEHRIQLLEELQARDAAGFGGSWYEPLTDVQHINAVGSGAAAQARRLGDARGVTVVTHEVAFSLTQLQAIAADINTGGHPVLGRAAIDAAVPDPVANKVTVRLPAIELDRIRNSVRALPSGIELTEGEAPTVTPDACVSRFSCSTPLRGGIVLWAGAANRNECSLGYTARAGDGSRWALTAGHCGAITGPGPTWGHGTGAIGPMIEGRNSGNVDVARIHITNPYWQTGGYLYDYFNRDTPAVLHHAILARGTIQAGDIVCLNAWHSISENCGGIVQSFGERGMPRVNYDACPGDSGGGWFYVSPAGARLAYGLHSWSEENSGENTCHFHWTNDSYFTAIPDLNAHWDATTAARLRIEHF